MRTPTRFLAVAGVVVLLGVALTHAPRAGAAEREPEGDPPAKLTVTPDSGLVDGQVITVAGTGWQPANTFNWLVVQLCPDDETDCQTLARGFEAGPDGTFSRDVRVRTIRRAYDGTLTDCRVVACHLRVEEGISEEPSVAAAVSFDPAAALPPDPIVTVSPDTDLIGGQEIVVQGTGFFPNEDVWMTTCDGAGIDPFGCYGGEIAIDAAGEFTTTIEPRELIGHWRGSHDCRGLVSSCGVYVFEPVNRAIRASAPLQLRPDGDEVVTATPTKGLVDGQTISISGTGLNEGHEVIVTQCLVLPVGSRYPYPCRDWSDPIVVPASREVHTTLDVAQIWTFEEGEGIEREVDCLTMQCEVIMFGTGVTFAADSYFDARGFWRSVPLTFADGSVAARPVSIEPRFTG